MRKLLALAIVVGLLLAGDAWARATAERRLASELQSSLGATGDTKIALGGFPFLFGAISGNIPSATVAMNSLVRNGVRLDGLRMTLQDLSFSLSEISSGDGSIRVSNGRGRAVIESSSLVDRFVGLPPHLELDIGPRGLRASLGEASGRAGLSLDGTDLVLAVGVIDGTFRAPLPRLLDGISYDSVTVSGYHAVLQFSLEEATLKAR